MSSESSSGNGRPPTPLWLDAVRRLERAIGGPAERWLTSDAYFDLLPHARRAQAQLEATVAALTDEWYRLMNVPSASDMRQMRTQLARMERQLQRMAKELEDARTATANTPAEPDETD
jgi:type II secretory pathway component PulM